jgi:hypothetical protein
MCDNWWSEPVEALLSSKQATPESFNKDVEGLLDSFKDFQFSTPLDHDGPFPTYCDPTTFLTSSLESIYTTDSSDYSCSTMAHSNYPSLFDIALRDGDTASEYTDVDPKDDSVSSGATTVAPVPAIDLSGLFVSFGPPQPELSAALFTHVQVLTAQSDDGLNRPPVSISPQSLSAAFHSSIPAVPTDPPVCAASMPRARKLPNRTQTRTGPIRTKKFVCFYCGRCKYHFHSFIFLCTQMFRSSICAKP